MISLRTNLSSIITQQSLTTSTSRLNQSIERMSTGYKINHAGDNAANYSISTNMNTQLNAYNIAQDNISMGMDMLSTAQDTIDEMLDRGARLQALITQARNGTYGTDSLAAIQAEANALATEIDRLYNNTEYNGKKLLEGVLKLNLPDWAQAMVDNVESTGFIAEVDTDTPDIIVSDPAQLRTAIQNNTKIGIKNAETLAQLAKVVNGTDGQSAMACSGKTFILMEDVDISAICAANTDSDGIGGWETIGDDVSHFFGGNFNGNGHKVSGLYINRPASNYQGLFGMTYGSIKNLGVEDVNVIVHGTAGGLVACSLNNIITNCYATGKFKGDTNVGLLCSNGATNYCYAIGDLECHSTSSWLGMGTHRNSYAIGTVSWSNIGIGMIYDSAGSKTSLINDDLIYDSVNSITTLQVGINSDSSSQITVNTSFSYELSIVDVTSNSAYTSINNFMKKLNEKAVELGAAQNRLESALESTSTNIENLTSSLSTVRDADIAKISSQFIQQQILQQAAATLMSTANQSPAIALQLI